MKFQVNKDVLSEAVSFAVRILPQKANLQILSGILIEADANALRLSVFDYEVSAQAEIVAKVEESGKVLVSGRLLSDIANRLPNAPVEFSTDGSKVTVTCGPAKFTLPTMDVNAYPTLPDIPATSGTVSGEDFSEAISQVAIAAAKDEGMLQLTGVMFETSEKSISVIATDRYRIALRDIPWKGTAAANGVSALVPARVLQEVAKTFGNQGEIAIAITSSDERGMIAFKSNNRSVTSQLIKGSYPPVQSLIPSGLEHYSVVSTQDLIDSTRRVSLVLERDSALPYTFTDSAVVLDAAGNETATASEKVSAELTGDEVVVSLKPQYVIDALSAVHSEFARISFTKSDNPHRPGPVLITAQAAKDKGASENYRYLLQPNLLNK